MQIPFCGPTYAGRSTNANASRCINFYPESTATQDDKSPLILVGTLGSLIKTIISTTTQPVRGLYSFNNTLFAVAANKLYSINLSALNGYTELGTLTTSTGRVSFADNGISASGVGGNQLMIVDGDNGYIYNVTGLGTFTTINDADFISNPTQVAYIDGYFVVIKELS